MLLVYFECSTENFGHLMQKLGPHLGLVSNLRIETQEEKQRRNIRQDRNPGGKAQLGINDVTKLISPHSRVQTIVTDLLKTAPNHTVTFANAKDALATAGLSPRSLSPVLSLFRRIGRITTDLKNETITLIEL